MLSFDQLYWLLVLPLPLLVTWLLPAHRERLVTVRLPFLDRLLRLTGQASETAPDTARTPRAQQLLSWLVWALVVAALARPPTFTGEPLILGQNLTLVIQTDIIIIGAGPGQLAAIIIIYDRTAFKV